VRGRPWAMSDIARTSYNKVRQRRRMAVSNDNLRARPTGALGASISPSRASSEPRSVSEIASLTVRPQSGCFAHHAVSAAERATVGNGSLRLCWLPCRLFPASSHRWNSTITSMEFHAAVRQRPDGAANITARSRLRSLLRSHSHHSSSVAAATRSMVPRSCEPYSALHRFRARAEALGAQKSGFRALNGILPFAGPLRLFHDSLLCAPRPSAGEASRCAGLAPRPRCGGFRIRRRPS